jgi:hypothetical protein
VAFMMRSSSWVCDLISQSEYPSQYTDLILCQHITP